MPPAQLSLEEVVDRLMLVVRQRGYDGASLAELSRATGLGKSSLYHYFPEGKEDMVRAVLERLETQLRAGVFEPLRASGSPRKRVEAMVKTIDTFYRGGREACVLANLVLGTSRSRFRTQLTRIFEEWIDALAVALVDGGVSRAVARIRAEDAVVRIEGALVVAGAMDDTAVFSRMLKLLSADLLAPPARAH
ncbi:MAG: TetR/AcrR family transcriptional regulator [bacterium]